MKYAFLFLFLSLSLIAPAQSRTITSFKKSDAITTIAQFMYEAGGDLQEQIRISDRKIASVNYKECKLVATEVVIDHALSSIKEVLRYYPDEDLPFEEAISDFEDYFDSQVFHSCSFVKRTKNSTINSIYYVDTSDRIHLRIDKITPLLD